MTTTDTAARTRLDRVLGTVERIGNKVPHPFILFAWLLAFVAVASTLLDALGVSVTIPGHRQVDAGAGVCSPGMGSRGS